LRLAMSLNLKKTYFAHIVVKKIKLKTKYRSEELRCLNKKECKT